MKLKVKFWDTERNFFLESAISCVTAFRNYIDIPAETRFSDCPNQPEKMRYIPVLFTWINDLWQGDIVEVDLLKFWGEDEFDGKLIRCEVVFDYVNGWWAVIPFKPEYDFDGFPLAALKDNVSKIGNKYESPELATELS